MVDGLVFGAFALIGLLHEGAGFVDCALRVVVGLDGEAILVDGAVTLAGHVEYAAEFDVAPDLDPSGVVIAAKGVAEGVGGSLVVALHEEDFADAVGGERAVLVGVKGLLVFDQGGGEVSLGYLLLAAEYGYADSEVGGALEEPVVGINADATGATEGLDGVLGVGAGDVDATDLGLAVGLDAEFDRHAEEVEVLGNGTDGAESFVAAEAEDGVFVCEGGRAGAVEPLGEERLELEVGLSLGDGFDIGGADGFVRILREEGVEEFEKDLVAHLPAEHMENHRALFKSHGLELRGEGVETADGGERFCVIGEGTGGDVGDGVLEGGFAGGVFEVHQLGVAGHAVGDPGIVHGGWRDLAAPPLMGEGVGEQALLVAGGDAATGDGCDLGGPGGGDGVVGEFDEVHVGGFGLAEGAGHEEVFALGLAGEVVGVLFVFFGDVDAHVAGGDGLDELAGDDGPGETGLGPLEGVLGAVAGEAFLRGDAAA